MSLHFTEPAKKHLGQNFLHDHGVIDKIVQAIAPRPGDVIVEIGPGQGALTFPLLKKHGEITAIEFDRDLHAPLQAAAQAHGVLHLIEGDVLGVDFTALAAARGDAQGQIRLAGNLPYNLSSPILFHALDHAAAIRDMHFMLQKEVVERMAAGPGSKVYGRLSVMLQAYCTVTPLFVVPPGAFRPAPKVDSAVVRLIPHKNPTIVAKDIRCLNRVCTEGFGQRRKTIRNSFSNFITDAQLTELGIDGNLRPENLSLEQFVMIANWLADQQQA